MLHLRVTGNAVGGWRATVLGTANLPRSPDATAAGDPANFEGIACVPGVSKSAPLVLLGDRGGARAAPAATLRWFVLQLETMQVEIDAAGHRGFEVLAPAQWRGESGVRPIAELAVDAAGVVWASATRDPADAGPFESRIYPIARLARPALAPMPIENGVVRWRLDGIKVEALVALDETRWFFASDDASYGGAFGLLPTAANESTAP